MQCRHCGTEIADKALICYRCGAATTDPVRKPVVVGKPRSGLFSLVGIVLLVLLGLYLGYAGRTMEAARSNTVDAIAGVCIGAALMLLVLRIIRRRR